MQAFLLWCTPESSGATGDSKLAAQTDTKQLQTRASLQSFRYNGSLDSRSDDGAVQ
jgi:hypothetical protein